VRHPPPGFPALSELHKQPLISPVVSAAAPGQCKYIPAMPGSLHPQMPLPNLPMANTMQSDFIPQPSNVLMQPVMYHDPLLASALSLTAQLSVLYHLLYENLLHWEQLKRYYTLWLLQNIGAPSLVNPFMVPVLNPPAVYIPTPGSEGITNVGQSELSMSEVPSCTLPSQKNASGQISPSGTGQLAAAAYVSAEDTTSAPAKLDTHNETKAPASVMSYGISNLSVNSSTDLCTADVLCDERPAVEAMASPKEEKSGNSMQYGTDTVGATTAEMGEFNSWQR